MEDKTFFKNGAWHRFIPCLDVK